MNQDPWAPVMGGVSGTSQVSCQHLEDKNASAVLGKLYLLVLVS